jgi:D-serine dehydratase
VLVKSLFQFKQQKLFQAQCKTILDNLSLIERQRIIIKDFQDETGITDIESLKSSLSYANKRVGWAEDEIKTLKEQLNRHQSIADNEVSEINSKKLTIESQLLAVMNELGSLRTDFKKNVEKEVEKELKKIKTQEKKDKEKLKRERAKLKALEASSDSE